jgi:predicted O-methyltransferase YrrM
MNLLPAAANWPLLRPHRTPRYTRDRLRQMRYERANPDTPWLTPQSISLLSTLLRPTDLGAEFGSGRSTLWLASRIAALTSVEHDERWHTKVTAALKDRGADNVEYILAPEDQPLEKGADSAYARTALSFADGSLDFALVDGHYRDSTALFILPKIRPGGMLVIDNVNWYLPSSSRAPNSRSELLGPVNETWAGIWQDLRDWRRIWTSSGVWDTAIFFKPVR